MKAIVYDFNVPTYLLAKSFGKWIPSLYDGKRSALSLQDRPSPTLPNENWVKLKTIHAGVCGSDLGAIFYKTSPAMTPFNSFPSILGHEVVGIVTEVGMNVDHVQIGDRITVDPYIGCEVRGIHPLCPACSKGMHSLCRHTGGSERLGPGMILGFTKEFPGAWSEEMIVHESMVIPVPEHISNKTAVLSEPLSVGLHAVLRHPPTPSSNVLIIGGGMIAYSVIIAIKLLKLDCHITHMSLLPYQKEYALTLGADQAFTSLRSLENFMLHFSETTKHHPAIGKDVYRGGFDHIFDCIGSVETIDQSLRYAKERGTITLVGCASKLPNLDLTFVWANELTILGTHAYAKKEQWDDQLYRTQSLLFELLSENDQSRIESLITHEFTLDQYREAIRTNIDRQQYQSMKTIFTY